MNFKEYFHLKEGIRSSGNPDNPYDIFDPIDENGDYIIKANEISTGIMGMYNRFTYKAYKVVPNIVDTVHAFRTPKNAAKEYIQANPGLFNIPQLHNLHNFQHEVGGKSLSPNDYNAFVEQGIQMFLSSIRKINNNKNTAVPPPTHIITPSSSSPHAWDIARRIVATYNNFNNFLPNTLRKSTKAEIFQDVFNIEGVDIADINQDLINHYVHKYRTIPEFRDRINTRMKNIIITDRKGVKENPKNIMLNFIHYLVNANIPLDKQISMADNIRIGPAGKAHDRNMSGYFDHSNELINAMQTPGVKHVWIIDDNVSTGSTVAAGEEFFRKISDQFNRNNPTATRSNRVNIIPSWVFLIYKD